MPDGFIKHFLPAETEPVRINQLAEDLRKAKALIDAPEKWVKGCVERGGGHCIVGAISVATGVAVGHFFGTSALDVYEALQRAIGDRDAIVAHFNDNPRTQHADIMSLFDHAIAAAEQEQG